MTSRGRVYANLATLANGLVGVGAVAYILAGNKLWAMLLIVAGLGFDGLDGLLSRRSGVPGGWFGRVADSVSDSVTFGVAPAVLVIVHTDHPLLWAPWGWATLSVGIALAILAVARLVYFTLRAHHLPYFLGAPTPQTALAVIAFVLFGDVPGFWGTDPLLVVVGTAVVAILMVVPVRFPKIRRGNRLRTAMTVTAVALVVAILPLQFRPSAGSPLYLLALAASLVGAAGIALYYLAGPWSLPAPATPAPPPGDVR
ncbi:MAG: CDP-alcohol phosphatidyltransferase family protein [Thermoplasmata archaeon]|nr:CDP-alcohol phosphatidyltransferase family protein [Thermoplasmata archaeon]